MDVRPPILCPVDFSDASAGALRYAAAVSTHLGSKLLALTVEHPLLTEAMDLGTGVIWRPDEFKRELERFVTTTLGPASPALATLQCEVAVGIPSAEILRVARERSCSLIVISSHGLTGLRKLFFGSTTERVLREAPVPVLVTPPLDPGHVGVEDAKRLIARILVPVDLSAGSRHQAVVARDLADALGLPLILVHVVEPLKSGRAARLLLASVEADRRSIAEDGLKELMASLPARLKPEALVAYGDPAEEVAKVAQDRRAGLIVVGLHGSPLLGPRMGSVTYRLLCLSQMLVLALPPETEAPARAEVKTMAMSAANRSD